MLKCEHIQNLLDAVTENPHLICLHLYAYQIDEHAKLKAATAFR